MTYPGSSSAETDQAAIPPEANRASIRRPTPQDGAAASDRQDTIQSLENLASSGRPLAELLEDAKHLLRASNPDPNVTVREESVTKEKARPAEIEQEASGGRLSHRAETASRLYRSGHAAQIWRRAWLQVLAALGAAVVGYAFAQVVAGNDRAMRVFFATAVALGLFFVFSAFATQLRRRLNRGRRKRLY
jgi:hypothetical protein